MKQLFDFLSHPPVENQPLSAKTSFGMGGPCDLFCKIATREELHKALSICKEKEIDWFLIGRGTNLIVRDTGFRGVVFHLVGDFEEIAQFEGNRIHAGAGVGDFKLARFAREHGLSGMEFLSTVPGTLGGAVVMNAGAHGQDISQILEWAEVLDDQGIVHTLSAEDLRLSYRHSILKEKRGWLLLSAQFVLKEKSPERIKIKENLWKAHRKETQPIDKKTFGSLFKNPEGHAAGRLIDELGLKGQCIDGIKISLKHANFLENSEGGSFEGLMELVRMIQDRVLQDKGIRLELEAEIFPRQA